MPLSAVLAMYCKLQSRVKAVGIHHPPRNGYLMYSLAVTLGYHKPRPEDV